MEEQALYRAILDAPHDDTARLVYADWLDENADSFPGPLARAERARAAFIRVQCALARAAAGGWKASWPAEDVELNRRQKRLLFHHGKKWRRAFLPEFSSAPFDRGFLRPLCALRPSEFLQLTGPAATFHNEGPALPGSPARRYWSPVAWFDAFPLWDLHLFAPNYTTSDPGNDRGQYGPMLAEIGRDPALARVGWLKVSFFHTPVLDFLASGNFPNVETLVLNSAPFPQVLDAVASNESFRNLRYVQFGDDWWLWSGFGLLVERERRLIQHITEANGKHLPHGEMRPALARILRDLPPATPPPQPAPAPRPAPNPPFKPTALQQALLTPEGDLNKRSSWVVGTFCVAICLSIGILIGRSERTPLPRIESHYDFNQFRPSPSAYDPKQLDEVQKMLQRMQEQRQKANDWNKYQPPFGGGVDSSKPRTIDEILNDYASRPGNEDIRARWLKMQKEREKIAPPPRAKKPFVGPLPEGKE